MTLTTEVHHSIDAVADEWRELAHRLDAAPFLHPDWIRIWHEAFGSGRPEILAIRRNGRLAGLLPLERYWGALRSPTNWHTPLYGPLAEDAAVHAELARSVFRLPARSIFLAFLDPASAGFEPLVASARASDRRVLVRTYMRSPFVAIRGEWEQYLQGLSSNLRHDLRRKWRRLGEAGEVAFETTDGTSDLDALLGEGFRTEAASWKGARGTAIASRPDTRRFYEEVARWAAGAGLLRLSFLRLGGQPIAFVLGCESRETYYAVKLGYDPAFWRFSPGKLITALLLERAFALRLRAFEFLGADEPHKTPWTPSVHELQLVQAFAPSLPGRGELIAHLHGRPLAKRAVRLVTGARQRVRSGRGERPR